MTIQKFRKKPVEIEAMQLTDNWREVCDWVNANTGRVDPLRPAAYMPSGPDRDILIVTLEGDMRAVPGDWIIRGVQGEFYPCKPDIFDATYEALHAPIKRGPWVRRDTLPPVGSKLVAGNTGKVVYEVVEHGTDGWRLGRVRLRDTRNGRSVGWQTAHYYRYLIEENNA